MIEEIGSKKSQEKAPVEASPKAALLTESRFSQHKKLKCGGVGDCNNCEFSSSDEEDQFDGIPLKNDVFSK